MTMEKSLAMSGLDKQAGLGDYFRDKDPDLSNAKRMTYEEQNELWKKLEEKYNFKGNYFPIRDITQSGYNPHNDTVYAPNVKEIILHEVGHALDPHALKNVRKAKSIMLRAPGIGALGSFAGAVGAGALPAEEEEEYLANSLLGGLAGSTVGGAVGFYGGRKMEKTEDVANDFVKRYLTDELGSKELAEKAFDDSSLPEARRTYRRNTGRAALSTFPIAFLGGSAGFTLISKAREFQNERNQKEASLAMSGLDKQAGIIDYFRKPKLDWDRIKVLPDEEFDGMMDKVRDQYGFKSRFIDVDDPRESVYSPDMDVVFSTKDRDMFLHEAGHALDPDVTKNIVKAHELMGKAPVIGQAGALAGAAGASVIPSEERNNVQNGLIGGAVGASLGSATGFLGGRKLEKLEDKANSFVKRYLTDELGSKELADKAFNDSALPLNRNTYRVNTTKQTLMPLKAGAAGAAMGVGAGAVFNHFKDKYTNKEASLAMSGLYKQADEDLDKMKRNMDEFARRAQQVNNVANNAPGGPSLEDVKKRSDQVAQNILNGGGAKPTGNGQPKPPGGGQIPPKQPPISVMKGRPEPSHLPILENNTLAAPGASKKAPRFGKGKMMGGLALAGIAGAGAYGVNKMREGKKEQQKTASVAMQGLYKQAEIMRNDGISYPDTQAWHDGALENYEQAKDKTINREAINGLIGGVIGGAAGFGGGALWKREFTPFLGTAGMIAGGMLGDRLTSEKDMNEALKEYDKADLAHAIASQQSLAMQGVNKQAATEAPRIDVSEFYDTKRDRDEAQGNYKQVKKEYEKDKLKHALTGAAVGGVAGLAANKVLKKKSPFLLGGGGMLAGEVGGILSTPKDDVNEAVRRYDDADLAHSVATRKLRAFS